jgi:hypothetical protein
MISYILCYSTAFFLGMATSALLLFCAVALFGSESK